MILKNNASNVDITQPMKIYKMLKYKLLNHAETTKQCQQLSQIKKTIYYSKNHFPKWK